MKKILLLSIMCGFAVVGMLQTVQLPSQTTKLAWWGVMYPNFCVTDVTQGTTADTLTEVPIRFRIAEWFGKA